MCYGYAGKILFVDLSNQKTEIRKPDESTYRKYLGGAGLGTKIVFDHVPQHADPFGPENLLGFVTGPLTGTGVPGGGRFTVVAKSPVTGGCADANSGGYWGPELKKCGFDAVFFSGIAKEPVYITIIDDEITFRSAKHLWGQNTYQTNDLIQNELENPSCKVACIGPAGEKLSMISGIVNEKGRIASRAGVGAVMGSKLLKAVVVQSTRSKKLSVFDQKKLNAVVKTYTKNLRESNFHRGLTDVGTGGGTSFLLSIGDCPTRNWKDTGKDSMPTCTNLDSARMDKYKLKKYGCHACTVRCGALIDVKEGSFKTKEEIHRPEYETLAGMGTLCLNDNIEAVIKANEICNMYGIDTIAAGGAVAFAIECFEKGLISTKDTGGLELKWGDGEVVVHLTEMIAKQEGIGQLLSQGVRKASETIGGDSKDFAMQVGGHRLAFHDPRMNPSLGAHYICDPQPGHHMGPQGAELLENGANIGDHPLLKSPGFDVFADYDKKGPLYVNGSAYFQLLSSGGMCALFAISMPIPVVDLLAPITGWDLDWDEGLKTGKRILNIRQAFNAREGIKPDSFKLPKRFEEALKIGPGEGKRIDYKAVKKAFFGEMKWDLESGIPDKKALEELDLDFTDVQ
jgi:aldehyde:ferredoxin oxidoreductase